MSFRFTSGIGKFENFISDLRAYHQKTQNRISGGLLAGIFEVRTRLVRQKSILVPFGCGKPNGLVTVKVYIEFTLSKI